MTVEVLYFGNPMCSWCWGFAPVLDKLRKEFSDEVGISLGLGSLRQDERPMQPQQKDYIRNHWQHVIERSGQPFDFTLFDREDFCYDDRFPASLVAACRTETADKDLDLFHMLQGAFYRDGIDITSSDKVAVLIEKLGIDPMQLMENASKIDIVAEYNQTARLGVSGYPTLLAVHRGNASMLSLGYSDWTDVKSRLRDVIDAQQTH